MLTRRFNANSLPHLTPHYPLVNKLSTKTCQEHTTQMVEVWQGNIRVSEYCPVCYREQMKEGSE